MNTTDYYITGNDASLPATLNLIIGHYSKCDNSEGGMWAQKEPSGVIKSSHIPLLWRTNDSPRPYRFSKESEERPQFYRLKARFMPNRSTFGFVELLQGPLPVPKRERKAQAVEK